MTTMRSQSPIFREPLNGAAHEENSNIFNADKLSRLREWHDERVVGIFLMLDGAGVAGANNDMQDRLFKAISNLKLIVKDLLEIDSFDGDALGYGRRIDSYPEEFFDYNFRGVVKNGTSGDFILPLYLADPKLSSKDGFPAPALADGTFTLATGADADVLTATGGAPNTNFTGTWRLLFQTVKSSTLILGAPYIMEKQTVRSAFDFPHNKSEVTVAAGAYSSSFTNTNQDEVSVNGALLYDKGTTLAQLQDYRDISAGRHLHERLYQQGVAEFDASAWPAANVRHYKQPGRIGDFPQGQLSVNPAENRDVIYIKRGRINGKVLNVYRSKLGIDIDSTKLTVVGEVQGQRLEYAPDIIFPVDTGIDTAEISSK